jgi:hypothetical protein
MERPGIESGVTDVVSCSDRRHEVDARRVYLVLTAARESPPFAAVIEPPLYTQHG